MNKRSRTASRICTFNTRFSGSKLSMIGPCRNKWMKTPIDFSGSHLNEFGHPTSHLPSENYVQPNSIDLNYNQPNTLFGFSPFFSNDSEDCPSLFLSEYQDQPDQFDLFCDQLDIPVDFYKLFLDDSEPSTSHLPPEEHTQPNLLGINHNQPTPQAEFNPNYFDINEFKCQPKESDIKLLNGTYKFERAKQLPKWGEIGKSLGKTGKEVHDRYNFLMSRMPNQWTKEEEASLIRMCTKSRCGYQDLMDAFPNKSCYEVLNGKSQCKKNLKILEKIYDSLERQIDQKMKIKH